MIVSPPMSGPCSGAVPSPRSRICPWLTASQPCSITRSGSTIRALVRTKQSSCMSALSGCPHPGESGDVDEPVGETVAHVFIVKDTDHRGTRPDPRLDEIDD